MRNDNLKRHWHNQRSDEDWLYDKGTQTDFENEIDGNQPIDEVIQRYERKLNYMRKEYLFEINRKNKSIESQREHMLQLNKDNCNL